VSPRPATSTSCPCASWPGCRGPKLAEVPGWQWLTRLPAALRTSLAATLLLGGFAASFWLTSPQSATPNAVASASLDAVPETQLVNYLLTSGARVETADLAALTAADPELTKGFLHASDAELTDMLDAQPSDESTYL
jgi:hypothetical protein